MNIIKIISNLASNHKQSLISTQTNTEKDQGLPSLDFAFDLVKERIDNQLSRIDGLDTKANFVSGAALGVLGIALTLQTFMLSLPRHSYCSAIIPSLIYTLPSVVKHAIIAFPLICVFVVVILCSQHAYRLDEYKEVPVNPEEIFRTCLEQEVDETKIDIYSRMIVAFKINEEKLEEKAKRISRATLWLDIEIATFVILFICLVIC